MLALVALILAAGVLSLRAAEMFNAPIETERSGSGAEQSLTHLLEPIAGVGNIRVSISGAAERTVLILLNGPDGSASSAATQIETIAAIALNLDVGSDALTVTQFPFVQTAGPMVTASGMAELAALGLLCVLLAGMLIAPEREAETPGSATAPEPAAALSGLRLVAETPPPTTDADVDRAAQIAMNDPSGTARLIRKWIGEGSAS